jgi:HTH-type transcriptional regulator/antitoxin HigA
MKLIKNSDDYERATERIYTLLQQDIVPNSPESDELEILSLLVEDYEKKLYALELPSPIEAVKFRLEQLNLPMSEFVSFVGERGKASELLSGKRPLSLAMRKRLHQELGVPASSLLSD